MKKGFILALLMVAMVAMVIPAGAKAPVIQTLPSVIIGDADPENISTDGTQGIMRKWHAFDLADTDVVNWNNDGYTTDLFKAYLYTDGVSPYTAYKSYDGSITPLSGAEFTALTGSGTVPTSAEALTSASAGGASWDFWVNLIDSDRHPGIADPFAADPDTDGVAFDTYATSDVLTIVCGVTSDTLLKLDSGSWGTFDVESKSSSTGSVIGDEVVNVEDYDFTTGANGWTYVPQAGFEAATEVSGASGIGFDTGSGPSTLIYATWLSPSNIAGDESTEGLVYRAVFTLNSSASTYATVPNFRIASKNLGETFYHSVWFQAQSEGLFGANPPSYTADAIPVSGAADIRLYWDSMVHLSNMADAEEMADWVGDGSEDGRLFSLIFDAIVFPGQSGTLVMEACKVDAMPTPDAASVEVSYGASSLGNQAGSNNVAFNDATNGFIEAAPTVSGFTYSAGTATVSASQIVATLPAVSGSSSMVDAFAGTIPFNTAGSTLYRSRMEVASQDPDLTPEMRLSFTTYGQDAGFTIAGDGDIIYELYLGTNSDLKARGALFAGAITSVPTVPKSTTQAVDLYYYAWPQQASVDYTVKQTIRLLDIGAYGGGSTFAAPNGSVTVNFLSWENLGADAL